MHSRQELRRRQTNHSAGIVSVRKVPGSGTGASEPNKPLVSSFGTAVK